MKLKIAILALLISSATARSSPVTSAIINGSWELRTACTNNHGKPGSCIEMKHGSMDLTFGPDGNWSMVANDQNGTKKSGSYEIRKERIMLKNADGSLYQDWQPEFSPDEQSFVVAEKQLIETFARVTK
jgi:hypothetical protein